MEDQTPFDDVAAPILKGDPALSDESRAQLWDVFHGTKNPDELAEKLQTLAVPEDTKKNLYHAKQKSMPPVSPVRGVTDAMQMLANMDPKVLDIAETHPNVLKTLTAAAAPKEPTGGSGASVGAGAGKTQGKAQKLPPLVQPPRQDGLEHLPPIPDQHYRVQTSDGGIHDIPVENIETARQRDPNLHVLNP